MPTFASSNLKQQHIMPKIYSKKQLRYGLWVMECPKCGAYCASAPTRDELPQLTTCNCDGEGNLFNTNFNNTHYRVIVWYEDDMKEIDREYVGQAKLIYDEIVRKGNYGRVLLMEIRKDGTTACLRESNPSWEQYKREHQLH